MSGQAPNPNLNPSARPFTFNPSAGTFNPNAGAFVPGGQPNYYQQPQQQQPNYYQQQQYAAPQQQGASGYPLIGGQPNYYQQQPQQGFPQQQQQQGYAPQQQGYQQQQYQQQYQQRQAPQQQQAPTQAAKPAAVAAPKPAAAKAGPPLSQAKSTISFVSNKPAAEAAPAAAAAAPAAAAPAASSSPAPEAAPAAAAAAAPAAKVNVDTAAASSSSSSSSAPASSPSNSDKALAKSVADLKLDEEEAKELALAEEEDRKKKIAITTGYAERKAHDEREHVNIVFIGHVDAGKSTISGQVLLLTGQVDERTIQKYEREAKEKNRESWYLAYVMDTGEEERTKGITVEVGRAHFATEKKRYTLLDAPGHKNYVPNMIGGASQADVGVLVISSRKGEFETGFDRGGQTREHAMLAKTLGLHRLIILVNKMDDPTVKWDQKRFDEIEGKLTPFLKKTGFNMKDVNYIPASGFTGANIRDPVSEEVCPWVKDRRSLFQVLDDMPPLPRDPKGGLRIPIIARYKDMGALFVLGKVESGTLVKDAKLWMMPNRIEVQCASISVDDVEVEVAKPGENVVVRIKGIEEEEVQEGFVLSYPDRPCRRAAVFEGQVAILDLLEHKPILTIGYTAILHVHALAVECTITQLVNEIDRKTGEPMPKKPKFLKNGSFANVRIKLTESVAFENFKDYQALGRFTLRDEGKTIAIGKVTRMKDE